MRPSGISQSHDRTKSGEEQDATKRGIILQQGAGNVYLIQSYCPTNDGDGE
jgi:hypothetical protein